MTHSQTRLLVASGIIAILILGIWITISSFSSSPDETRELSNEPSEADIGQLQAEKRQEREQASEAILKEHGARIQRLIELADTPDRDEFRYSDWHDSKHLAILLLAELRAGEAVDVLLEHLEYKNFHDIMTSYVSLAERHPAAEALSKIGIPAIGPTIEKLGRSAPNSRASQLCCWVIKKVLGAKLARARLEMAIEEARDEAVKQNLKAALPYFKTEQEKAAEERARGEKGAR
jgi:hypothetical protein